MHSARCHIDKLTSLDLRCDNSIPNRPCRDYFACSTFALVTSVQLFVLVAKAGAQSRTFMRTKEAPVLLVSYTFHKEVGYPHSREQISCPLEVITIVTSEVQEGEDVWMAWLDIERY